MNIGLLNGTSMTQEEFLEKYKGKFIEISNPVSTDEIVWMFDVQTADFSQDNGNFIGWVSAKKTIFGYKDKIETYKEDEITLRPGDKVEEFKGAKELEDRIVSHLKTNLVQWGVQE